MRRHLIRVARPAMGSLFEIYAGGADAAHLEAAANRALDTVDALEQRLSHFLPDSDIALMNARACAEPVPVAPWLWELLLRLRQWSAETEGAFDPTAGKLVRAWGFFRRGAVQGESVAPPEPKALARIVAGIGWHNIELNAEARTVRFLTPEVELHLGAVGKGYIVQQAADRLRAEGIECALLHCGQSSIAAIGTPPDAEGWPVGIADPDDASRQLASVRLRDAALTTSGGAEQYVTVGGKRCSHLFDPRTGLPIHGVAAVSVVSPDAAEGDAVSTAFAVQGADWARGFCATRPALGALFAPLDSEGSAKPIVTTGGFDALIK